MLGNEDASVGRQDALLGLVHGFHHYLAKGRLAQAGANAPRSLDQQPWMEHFWVAGQTSWHLELNVPQP